MRLMLMCTGLLLSVVTLGCSSDDKAGVHPTVPGSGTIQLDGQPLAGAAVTFIPTGSTGGEESQGVTDDAGRYTLKTLHGVDGVAVGTHRVVVSKMVNADGSDLKLDPDTPLVTAVADGAKELIPSRYHSMEKSELSATVPAEGGEFNFSLKTK